VRAKLIFGATLVAMLGIVGVARGAEPAFQPGQWQTDLEVTIEGLPMAMPPQKHTSVACHTPEKPMPDTSDKSSECKLLEQKFEGSKLTWKMSCKADGGTAEGRGEITYSGSTYTGTFSVDMAMEGQKIRSVTRMKGKRLGDCPAR